MSRSNEKKLKNDIQEIKEFISSYPYSTKEDYKISLNNITEHIQNEEYRNDRANYLLEVSKKDKELERLLSLVSPKCQNYNCEECSINKYCNHYINETRRLKNLNSPKIIDLFCGAGGLSLGFTQEGFITVVANDIQECCVDTYAHNHPETPSNNIVLGDINNVIQDIEKLVGNQKVDIVIGGPPCQGFSTANRQRLIDDPRNHLYKSYVEVVDKVKPSFFVMENVKGMLNVATQVVEDFKEIGYTVSYRVLNAKDYGVPQNRERLIYIGNRHAIDNDKIFNEIASLSDDIPNFYLGDALFGLKPLEALRIKNATDYVSEKTGARIMPTTGQTNEYIKYINQSKDIKVTCNHKSRYNNDRDIEIYSRLNPGDKSDDPKIADIMPYKSRSHIFKDKYFKLEPNKLCKTITAHMKFDCNMYIHPSQARGLTPREAARVQSYPDDYFFRGSFTKTYMQVGNSVPPLLGRAIASILKQYL